MTYGGRNASFPAMGIVAVSHLAELVRGDLSARVNTPSSAPFGGTFSPRGEGPVAAVVLRCRRCQQNHKVRRLLMAAASVPSSR
jgi:hypothetical protein